MAQPAPDSVREIVSARLDREHAEIEHVATECRARLRRAAAGLADMGVERAWLYGSLAWGGFHRGSDVDVAVAGRVGRGLGPIEDVLGRGLPRALDIRRVEDLPPELAARIRREGEVLR